MQLSKMQLTSLLVLELSLLIAFPLHFRAGAEAAFPSQPSEELGRTLGLPVDVAIEAEGTKVLPPAFLNDLYECWSGDGSRTSSSDCPSKVDFSADSKTEVDLIRSFVGRYDEAAPRAVQSYNHDVELSNSMNIIFNSSCSMHHNETIHSAEIRIYKQGIDEADLMSKCDVSSGVKVQLYARVGTTSEADVVSLVDRVTLSKEELTSDRWVVFKNLTNLYRDFFGVIFNRSHNHSVAIRLAFEAPCSNVNPIEFGFTSESEKEVTITGFSKSPPSANAIASLTRAAQQYRREAPGSSGSDVNEEQQFPNLNELQHEHCQLYKYEVAFDDLGWGDYIIQPASYQANFCFGRCEAPLSELDNTTRHSYIQTIVNAYNPQYVPQACCVPSKLEPLGVIYREGPETFTLQMWSDMRASSCGCL